MRVEEVAQELGISKSHAYKVIHSSMPNSGTRVSDHLQAGQPERFHGEVLLWQEGKGGLIMAVYKEEKTNTWRAVYRYTDWNGERKQTQKRGFKTKQEAQVWEREQRNKTSADLDTTFKSFVDLYTADMTTQLKENTWATKDHIICTKLLPYFGRLKMCNITAQQIITWQNKMLNHKDENSKPYSPVYLKTVHNQLSAIFNHSVRYYNLRDNPCKKAGSMGKKKNREMMF